MAEKARYLEKDGKVELYASADLDAARKNGWEEPTTVRGNGEPWNPEPEGDEMTQAEAIEAAQKPHTSKKK